MIIRLEGAPHRYHADHITAKGMNSTTHHSLVRKFIPMPEAMKIPDEKAPVEKAKGKIGENTGMAADKSQKQKRIGRTKQGRRAEKFISSRQWISVISRFRS